MSETFNKNSEYICPYKGIDKFKLTFASFQDALKKSEVNLDENICNFNNTYNKLYNSNTNNKINKYSMKKNSSILTNKKKVNNSYIPINFSINRFYLKLIVSIIFICTFVRFNEYFLESNSNRDPLTCFYDKVFNWTSSGHKILEKNEKILDAYIITASLLMDIVFMTGMMMFGFYFKTFRLVFSLGGLYLFRGILQGWFMMSHPDEYIFRDPGVFSISVPYYKTPDYFFSGHVSLPIIMGMEFKKHGFFKLSYFSFFVSLFECSMMIFTRGHYSIDLYAGVIFAFYLCRISEFFTYYADKYLVADAYKGLIDTNNTNYYDRKVIEVEDYTLIEYDISYPTPNKIISKFSDMKLISVFNLSRFANYLKQQA